MRRSALAGFLMVKIRDWDSHTNCTYEYQLHPSQPRRVRFRHESRGPRSDQRHSLGHDLTDHDPEQSMHVMSVDGATA